MKMRAIFAAIAATTLSGAAAADGDATQRTVLVVVAHPDDELFFAPAIANEARKGSRVIIAYATDGDAGPGVSGMEPGEELADTRRNEAACSAQALGASPIHFALGDGKLAHLIRRSGSEAAQFRNMLSEAIGSHAPHVIMTWGADGGYGHADHRIVSAIATELVQEMDADARPELLYSAIVKGRMPEGTPFGRWAGTDPELLTVSYSYTEEDIARSIEATQCHKTQFDEASRAGLIPFLDQAVWRGEVSFREAF